MVWYYCEMKMSYICKNCGKLISRIEFKSIIEEQKNKKSIGCFLWIILIFCFVSIILIPIAIILYLIYSKKQEYIMCPYCNAKDSFIPDDTPIAQRMIKDNYSEEEIESIKYKPQKFRIDNKTIWVFLCSIILAYFVAIFIASL